MEGLTACMPRLIQHDFVLQNGTRWFKYDRDYLCVNKSQFVPVIFEPPCNKYADSRTFVVNCNKSVQGFSGKT